MTNAQRIYLMADMWPSLCRKLGCSNSRTARLDFLSRAVNRPLSSASELNSTTDFDAVKAEALAILQPDNLNAQMDQAGQASRRRRWAIKELRKQADDDYLLALLRSPRFKRTALDDLETMADQDFNQFRFTVRNRQGKARA